MAGIAPAADGGNQRHLVVLPQGVKAADVFVVDGVARRRGKAAEPGVPSNERGPHRLASARIVEHDVHGRRSYRFAVRRKEPHAHLHRPDCTIGPEMPRPERVGSGAAGHAVTGGVQYLVEPSATRRSLVTWRFHRGPNWGDYDGAEPRSTVSIHGGCHRTGRDDDPVCPPGTLRAGATLRSERRARDQARTPSGSRGG